VLDAVATHPPQYRFHAPPYEGSRGGELSVDRVVAKLEYHPSVERLPVGKEKLVQVAPEEHVRALLALVKYAAAARDGASADNVHQLAEGHAPEEHPGVGHEPWPVRIEARRFRELRGRDDVGDTNIC
jgi:hypothetical protein